MSTASTKATVELIPDPELGGFTACVPDIPAYGEGETEESAIEDMKEAIRAYIDTFGLDATLGKIRVPALKEIDLDFNELAGGQATASRRSGDDSIYFWNGAAGFRSGPSSRQPPRATARGAIDKRARAWPPFAENRNAPEDPPRCRVVPRGFPRAMEHVNLDVISFKPSGR